MYIYHAGAIGEAIRKKIDNTKSSIMNGTESSESFRSILFSVMENTSPETKVVGVANNRASTAEPIGRADGSTLIYAIANAANDSTASAVVNALGLNVGDNSIKTAADSLKSSLTLLQKLNGMSDESVFPQLSDFTEKFNTLLSGLRTNSTSSGFMYANLLKTAASTASDALAKAGITVSDDGKLSLDTEKFSELGVEGFLSTVSAAVNSISSYASSMTTSGTGVLDFLTEDNYSDGGYISTGNYYDSLMDYYT